MSNGEITITLSKSGLFKKGFNLSLLALLLTATFLFGLITNQLLNNSKNSSGGKAGVTISENKEKLDLAKIQNKVVSEKGYKFSILWGDLGKRLVADGVIDEVKLAQAITGKDTLLDNDKKYLTGTNETLELNQSNARFWLDVLWGLGLANKNRLLDEGDMKKYGDPASFASTGGYTLAKSKAMDYYSRYSYINLDEKKQALVEEIAGSVYRPCCGNSAAFPDCNHGMAMLALIELMASQNFSKDEIYKTALAFNTYWFPQTYLDIAYHFEKNKRDYAKVSPAEILSKAFSSSQGYAVIRKQVGLLAWPLTKSQGGCGA